MLLDNDILLCALYDKKFPVLNCVAWQAKVTYVVIDNSTLYRTI